MVRILVSPLDETGSRRVTPLGPGASESREIGRSGDRRRSDQISTTTRSARWKSCGMNHPETGRVVTIFRSQLRDGAEVSGYGEVAELMETAPG
jgi:hypothetical protein